MSNNIFGTLPEVKIYLRIDWDHEDDLIQHLYEAATQYILSLCRDFGEEEMPKPVQQAILILTSHLYDNRNAVQVGRGNMYELPFAVSALIADYREQGT